MMPSRNPYGWTLCPTTPLLARRSSSAPRPSRATCACAHASRGRTRVGGTASASDPHRPMPAPPSGSPPPPRGCARRSRPPSAAASRRRARRRAPRTAAVARPRSRAGHGSNRRRGASCAPTCGCTCWSRVLRASLSGPPLVACVRPERARRRELTELVPDHRLRHEHRHVLAAVVHGDRVPDHVGNDRRATRPRAHHVLLVLLVHRLDLLHEMAVDERSLLERPRHLAAPLPAATHHVAVRRLVLLACAALRLAPQRARVPAAGGLALAAAERVVDRVHRDAAHRRALALPTGAARLAQLDQLVLGVADGADRRLAGRQHQPRLAGGQAQRGHRAFLGHELDARAGRARHLGAGARLQLDRVHHGAHRDVAERQRVAGTDLGLGAGHQLVAARHAVGGDDVALLAVGVVQQGDPRRAVRVVLDVRDRGRHAVLVPTEVDHPVPALVAAALVARGDPPVDVAPGLVTTLGDERLLGLVARELVEVGHAGAAAPGGGRLVFANGHGYFPASKISMESPWASVTIARFWSARLPTVQPRRLSLTWRRSVFTDVTRTFQIAWTASLISVLFARGSTRKV